MHEIFLDKKAKAIEDRIIRDIKNFFQHEKEEENYYKPVRVINFWSNNYIEYESNVDRNKTLSVEKYLDKISPYLFLANHLVNYQIFPPRILYFNNF